VIFEHKKIYEQEEMVVLEFLKKLYLNLVFLVYRYYVSFKIRKMQIWTIKDRRKLQKWYIDEDLNQFAKEIMRILCEFYGVKVKKPKIFASKRCLNSCFYPSINTLIIRYSYNHELFNKDLPPFETVDIVEELSHYIRSCFINNSSEHVQEFFGRLGERILHNMSPKLMGKNYKPRNFSAIKESAYEIMTNRSIESQKKLLEKDTTLDDILGNDELKEIYGEFYTKYFTKQKQSQMNHHRGYSAAEKISGKRIYRIKRLLITLPDSEIDKIIDDSLNPP